MPYKYKKWKAREQQRDEAIRRMETESANLINQGPTIDPDHSEADIHSVPNTPEMVLDRDPIDSSMSRSLPKLDLQRQGYQSENLSLIHIPDLLFIKSRNIEFLFKLLYFNKKII